MSDNPDSEFFAELKNLRNGGIDVAVFQRWIIGNEENLKSLVSPSLLVKLKKGSLLQAMRAVAAILPSCTACRDICEGGTFLTREEYTTCSSKVLEAARNGQLKQVARPAWFYANDKHFGIDAYYACNLCGALWTLVTPEREDNGLWERIV